MVALVLMVIMLSVFYFTSQNAVLGTINFLLIGLLGSVLVPNLQTRLMDVAGRAQTLAAALNQAALNMATHSERRSVVGSLRPVMATAHRLWAARRWRCWLSSSLCRPLFFTAAHRRRRPSASNCARGLQGVVHA